VHTFLEHGPTITITFANAEGIEAGKTHVKYKSVDIGMVKRMRLNPERTAALVTVELDKQADAFLAADTRFWIVRPRIAAGEISGLNTLLSGPYIGVDIGKSESERHEFKGLEVPPIVTGDLPGHQYKLHAADLGSIDIGTPMYFRRVQVGEVVAYTLDADGKGVSLTVFVHAPFDRYVTEHTRFWHASGVDISIDGAGVRVDTQSLISVLVGGIAFEAMPGEIGAPVDLRGVVIGEVSDIGVEYDARQLTYRFPVEIHIYPDRLRSHYRRRTTSDRDSIDVHALLDHLVEQGLRAQLRADSLITGQMYVAMDFFPAPAKFKIDWQKVPQTLPTISGGFDDLQATLLSIAHKIDQLPLQEMSGDVRTTLHDLDQTLNDVDKLVKHSDADVVPELKTTLAEAHRALTAAERTLSSDSPVQVDTRQAMQELARASQSMRALMDLLARDPQAMIRGKSEPQKAEASKP
jgi:paraquat-inducible protein B